MRSLISWDGRTSAPAIAGALAGIVGLMVFLAIHHLWIAPIWFILPFGLMFAIGGGLAVGWAYREILPGLPVRPWRAPFVAGLITLMLFPGAALAEIRPPLFTLERGEAVLAVSLPVVTAHFVFELLLPAVILGGLSGWALARTRRAALAMAISGLIFALGPGHNIPFIGGTEGVEKEAVILLAVVATSAATLVEVHAWLLGRRAAERSTTIGQGGVRS
jgi:hypothetical protein